MRIGVHKNQPVASRRRRPGIARAGNVVDRLEDHGGARRPRGFRRPVAGIVITHNQFTFPADVRDSSGGRLDMGEGFAQKLLLVEGRDDDGNFHQTKLTSRGGRFKRQSLAGKTRAF